MRKILAFICAVCVFCAVLLCGCRTVEVVEVEVSEEVTTTATLPVKTTASTTTATTTTSTMTTILTGSMTLPSTTAIQRHPYITMYLDATEYEPDATVRYHLVDRTNTGFSARSLTLWKWTDEHWVISHKPSDKAYIRLYGAGPDTEKGYIDKSWSLNLSEYMYIQRGERYKVSVYADGYEISSEFTIAEE